VNTFQSLHTLPDTVQGSKKRLYRWRGGIHLLCNLSCSDDAASRRGGGVVDVLVWLEL
jgi:hypothetical protein